MDIDRADYAPGNLADFKFEAHCVVPRSLHRGDHFGECRLDAAAGDQPDMIALIADILLFSRLFSEYRRG
jgi:hypothetical protein